MVARLADIDGADISIIIPVFNESDRLSSCLSSLRSHQYLLKSEIIVCDGGSTDDFALTIEQFDCKLIQTAKGRSLQMNMGSQIATKQYLLFLHVDTHLPDEFSLNKTTQSVDTNYWGFFKVKLSGQEIAFRWIELFMNWRSRLTQIGTGDQTLYFHRNFFEQLGRFPSIPIMEDIAICKLAKGFSRPSITIAAVTTSSRRWETNGIVKTVLTMWGLRLAYWLGVPPDKLHRLYYSDL